MWPIFVVNGAKEKQVSLLLVIIYYKAHVSYDFHQVSFFPNLIYTESVSYNIWVNRVGLKISYVYIVTVLLC